MCILCQMLCTAANEISRYHNFIEEDTYRSICTLRDAIEEAVKRDTGKETILMAMRKEKFDDCIKSPEERINNDGKNCNGNCVP